MGTFTNLLCCLLPFPIKVNTQLFFMDKHCTSNTFAFVEKHRLTFLCLIQDKLIPLYSGLEDAITVAGNDELSFTLVVGLVRHRHTRVTLSCNESPHST